ncbi:hypothetical protein NMY3_03200 [Candidatus Nitrosocosmicus oleophilus]|uniref:Uncharacterized protein n=1 Tax=Candidatus Nitrosocosmicus oleophilus TaxID=1353260 RepID=A0A654M1P7_9ARCH|nr:hypothetical protein NMY3_03200 [Candidatus Nitrosocosmicus oleophilus]
MIRLGGNYLIPFYNTNISIVPVARHLGMKTMSHSTLVEILFPNLNNYSI